MGIQDGKTQYTLTRPVLTAFGGEGSREATWLELREPTSAHSRHYFKIMQMIMKAQALAAKFAKDIGLEDDDKIDGTTGGVSKALHEVDENEHAESTESQEEAIRWCLSISGVDIGELVEHFRRMACAGANVASICAVEGEVPMKAGIWQLMHPNDQLGAAIRWAAFFAMPDATQKPASGVQLELPSAVKAL